MAYTNVVLRNCKAFKKLGASEFYCPDGFHSVVTLDFPVSLDDCASSKSPDGPIIAHLEHCVTNYGSSLDASERFRLGRHQLLSMSFEEIELKTRQQLQDVLSSSGFDAASDIAGITVNRWPHGYASADDDCAVGRRRAGNVAIANSDSGNMAMLQAAIEQGHRAVFELL